MSLFNTVGASALALALVATGCGPVPADGPNAPTPEGQNASSTALPEAPSSSLLGTTNKGFKVEYVIPSWIKPAHRPDWNNPKPTPQVLKADEYDDIRFAAPQNYAITVPPANLATVRPMVEWEPMKAVIMSWPTYMLTADNASGTMAGIASNSATVAEVWVLTNPGGGDQIRTYLVNNGGMTQELVDDKVRVMETPIDSIWFIDSGPMPLIDTDTNTQAFSDFRYYHNRALDDGVPTVLARNLPNMGFDLAATTYRMPLSTEGGTFQATSDGICFTGNRQLFYMSCDSPSGCDNSLRTMPLADVQNHPLANEVRQVWADYMGCKDTIITNSITDDGTGHIDMYMKVVDDDTVMIGEYRAPFAPNTGQELNAARMDANAAFIEAYVKPGGGSFEVVRLVMPGHRSSNQSVTPFTYINSTFINGLNLWPATEFPDWEASRDIAQAEWEAAMPDYTHIYIDSTELSFLSGAIHCITRTVPDLPTANWVEDGTCADGTCNAPTGGYAGECSPNGLTQEVCWGPAWECLCNDCTQECPEAGVNNCPDGLTYTGCCIGDAMHFCDGGSYEIYQCQNGCGWAAGAGFYDCAGGQSNAQPNAEDPSGLNPRSCGAIFCEPDCTDKACGDDGCGGSCGDCEAGTECNPTGQCVAPCANECETGESGCDGDTAWTCGVNGDGCLVRLTTDCAAADQICASGACFDAPSTPDEGEDTGGPTADGGGDLSADAGPTPVNPNPGGGDDSSCASGNDGYAHPAMWLGLLLAFFGWRRRLV